MSASAPMRLAVALVCLLAPTVRAQTSDPVAWGLPAWWSADDQTQFLNRQAQVAGWLGLEPLATTPLPEGVREIRIRKASSVYEPFPVLRLVDDHGHVTDEGWLQWSSDGDFVLVSFLSGRCAALNAVPEHRICTGRSIQGADTLLAHVDRLGAWALSGDVPPPPGQLVIRGDGETFVVEVREGPRYRAYTYWSPQRNQEPHEAAAAELFELVRQRVWSMVAS